MWLSLPWTPRHFDLNLSSKGGTFLLCLGVMSLWAESSRGRSASVIFLFLKSPAGSAVSVNASARGRVKHGPGSGVDRLVKEKPPLSKCSLEPGVKYKLPGATLGSQALAELSRAPKCPPGASSFLPDFQMAFSPQRTEVLIP